MPDILSNFIDRGWQDTIHHEAIVIVIFAMQSFLNLQLDQQWEG